MPQGVAVFHFPFPERQRSAELFPDKLEEKENGISKYTFLKRVERRETPNSGITGIGLMQ